MTQEVTWIALLRHADKSFGSCHMYCTCSSITSHSKLYMSSLFIFIFVDVMFYLFYLQVEPVYLRVSNICYPNHFCVINIGNSSTTCWRYPFINMARKNTSAHQNSHTPISHTQILIQYTKMQSLVPRA